MEVCQGEEELEERRGVVVRKSCLEILMARHGLSVGKLTHHLLQSIDSLTTNQM